MLVRGEEGRCSTRGEDGRYRAGLVYGRARGGRWLNEGRAVWGELVLKGSVPSTDWGHARGRGHGGHCQGALSLLRSVVNARGWVTMDGAVTRRRGRDQGRGL